MDALRLLPAELPRLDLRALADILIVGLGIYAVLMMIKDTTAVMLVRGLAILVICGALMANFFNLPVLGWLIKQSIPAFFVALPILFQPELRRALEQLGRVGSLSHRELGAHANLIEVVAVGARRLADRRWGALLVLERETALGEFAKTGVELDALLTVDLLEQIFHPNTRLHDGAAIIRGERVLAAGCLLPLAESGATGQTTGTRHLAALGITEQTDAIVVVVSEETGQISLANSGRLVGNFDEDKLRRALSILFRSGPDVGRWLRPGGRSGGRNGASSERPSLAASGTQSSGASSGGASSSVSSSSVSSSSVSSSSVSPS
jgi:diadenylate cyclase